MHALTSTFIINLIGTSAFAVSGFMVGVRKRLDILGVMIVSLLTAIGGGMIRDVLVGQIPRVFRDNTTIAVIFLTLGIICLIGSRVQMHKNTHQIFIIADAVGLAAFSITGAQVGLDAGLNFFGVLMLAFVTAVGGGIVRDMLVNDVPIILQSDFYGSIALLVGSVLYVLHHFGAVNPFSLNMILAGGIVLRVWVHHKKIGLPALGGFTMDS